MSSFFKKCYSHLVRTATKPCTFGEKMEYRPKRGGRYSIFAVFDQNFEQIDPDTEAVVSVNQPRIELRLTDLPNNKAEQGDLVRVYNTDRLRHETYSVQEIQEDGIGAAVLFLRLLDKDLQGGSTA